jgi:hypothetical protein
MLTGLLVVVFAAMAVAADDDASSGGVLDQMQGQMRQAPASQPAPETPATEQAEASATGVLDEVQSGIAPNPVIEPSGRGSGSARPRRRSV